MIYHYLDASAWVKRYYQEIGSDWIHNFFARNPTIACATLGLVEVIATFARKHKGRQITDEQLQQILQTIQIDWENFIQIPLHELVISRSLSLATQFALRGADAIHLAAAEVLKTNVDAANTLILITSDQELKIAAQRLGIQTLDPEQEEDNCIT